MGCYAGGVSSYILLDGITGWVIGGLLYTRTAQRTRCESVCDKHKQSKQTGVLPCTGTVPVVHGVRTSLAPPLICPGCEIRT